MSDKKRKLVAIVFTDIAGFSELSASDENRAIELVNVQRKLIQPIIDSYAGTLHKEIGDGLLITFTTVTSAINCAIEIQQSVKNIEGLDLRIGIHEGEINLLGDDAKFNVKLITPIAMNEKLNFAIREGGKTVGAGVVTKILE